MASVEVRKSDGKKDKIVLFAGRITFQKGPDVFVRAAEIVIRRLPGVRFVMAGAGDLFTRMIELAADLGLGKYFHYTGFLSSEKLGKLYADSDVYVMPSVSEPFGIAPLEAMRAGTPVIISKQSGVREIIQNCIEVDFWDVEGLAREIERLLRDDAFALHLAQEGAREAQLISWDQAAQELEAIFTTVIGDS